MSKGIIWIVDDDSDICEMIKDTLIFYNYDTRSFPTADKAVNALNALDALKNSGEAMPALIITDYDTRSKMNGLDVGKKANEMDIPVIMQSATPDIGQQAKLSGVKGFLEKPFAPKVLMDMAQRVISESGHSKSSRGDRAV